MARVTVYGAGAMGTAFAIHSSRAGNDTILWASEFDARVLPALQGDRKHPALPEHLPDSLRVMGPDDLAEASANPDYAVMGAHSGGARTLAQIVAADVGEDPVAVSLAKGLEPETGKRMSEVYAEEVGHSRVVAVAGPCLAGELAEGLPSAVVFAGTDRRFAEGARDAFQTAAYRVHVTDDVIGVEYCTVLKNVAAIGLGILDGMAKGSGDLEYRNAKSALFAQAVGEQVRLITALGGTADTVMGLAGLGDTLVTSLGGRNRLYGELLGEGSKPREALDGMVSRGMTVEGVDSARDVGKLTAATGVDVPFHAAVNRIVFEDAEPASILESLT
ncbi:MAG: NAD(P)H-dependent glycerol-3-phosphate dehydrogenase [Actinomycetota bacterium]